MFKTNCLHLGVAIDKKIAERPSYRQHLVKDTEIIVGQGVMQEFERRYAAGEPMGIGHQTEPACVGYGSRKFLTMCSPTVC